MTTTIIVIVSLVAIVIAGWVILARLLARRERQAEIEMWGIGGSPGCRSGENPGTSDQPYL